jgi:hypothetical protein
LILPIPGIDLRISTSRRSPLCSTVDDRSLNAAHSFVESARGAAKLAVDDAQPGDEGADVDAGGLGNAIGHLDGGLA